MAEEILVVDDEAEIGELFSYSLGRQGYEVVVARNGPEAFELIRKRTPDLIILDLMMPGMDGYEILRRVRNNSETRLVPVVVLTARTDTKNKIVAFEHGADQYVCKPITMAELLARVRCLLHRARTLTCTNQEAEVQAVAVAPAAGTSKANQGSSRPPQKFIDRPLTILNIEYIHRIDDALAKSGPFGEVKLIKAKGKLRFIQRTESESLIDSTS